MYRHRLASPGGHKEMAKRLFLFVEVQFLIMDLAFPKCNHRTNKWR